MIIIGFGLSLILMGMMYIPGHDMHLISYLQFLITTPVLFWLGAPIFRAAFGALRNKTLNMDVMYIFWPSLFLCLTILAVNLLGDALRDILDPKLRESY